MTLNLNNHIPSFILLVAAIVSEKSIVLPFPIEKPKLQNLTQGYHLNKL